MSEGLNRSDIVGFFLVEASEHLQILNDGLLALEANSKDTGVIDEIFRSAHTIKGSAAMLGFNVVSKLAHKMEDLLGKIRSEEIELSEAVIDLLLHSIDTLTLQVDEIPSGAPEDESLLLMFEDLYREYLEGSDTSNAAATERIAPLPPESTKEDIDDDLVLENEFEEGESFEDVSDEDLDIFEAFEELPVDDKEAQKERPLTGPKSPELALEGTDTEKARVSSSKFRPAPKPQSPHAVTAAPQRSMVSASDKKIVKVEVEGLDLLMNLVGEMVINRTRLDQRIAYVHKLGGELNFSQERLLKVIRDFKEKYEFGQALADSSPQPSHSIEDALSKKTPSSPDLLDDFFDMEFDKYDDFNILSRSLVEIGSDISEIMNQLTEFFDQFEEESSQIQRITNELQEEITNIRMVPVGQLFNRFHRTVRDVAKQEGKQVSLTIAGEEAKLDKTVINEIADPLMHLVRNSVSHGIESPEKRQALGKDPQGYVALNAFKEGDSIIIEVTDDGSGIHLERVREIIAEKGLCSMAETERLSDDEVMKYIFAPGFSTTAEVSSISGRGVGMDVVKTNIAKLGGIIDIKTSKGQGTKFSITLPLTLVISAALLLQSSGQEFAIPLSSVEETARIPAQHIHNVGRQEVIKLRDQVLPLRRLNKILQYSSENTPTTGDAYVPIVIVRSAEQSLALLVDELIGQETIVIKSLGDYLKKVRLFSGATISGEGNVRLILDISTIIDQELLGADPKHSSSGIIGPGGPIEAQPDQAVPQLLLVDDSISIRKIIGMLLEKAGYEVDTAVDGVDAVEKCSEKNYDLIVTDLEMPRMHGYELIAEIRSGSMADDIPIIVMTSRAGEKHYKKAMQLGANDYIIKPVEEESLVQSVRTLLAKKKAGRGAW
ncbi:hypothetical protein CSB45_03540 [candidate division KSB3 bacterium]|uniref:Chemotaxis protein CheA n=1 Tax=candidate division KSB3 bacterium TaxID=2044937 RepID=A0A2G6E961_9BACT|nr:MAG: hypothetical protein CSB45_03540 [candidate division KSB3 bacterium]PIE29567.1 MAG: hypothetical protein CSA57_08135 [candidate division KSB3 bacterium]